MKTPAIKARFDAMQAEFDALRKQVAELSIRMPRPTVWQQNQEGNMMPTVIGVDLAKPGSDTTVEGFMRIEP